MLREPAVSGMFYPADPKALLDDIEVYLKQASPEEIRGDIKGMVSPHAGYMYSGAVAAWGYKALLMRKYDTVIIIAPSHKAYFEGAAVQERGGYRTPLGIVQIDEEFASELVKESKVVQANTQVHKGEHSLEVQLPFLQVVLQEFRMVPLIMGTQDSGVSRELASALSKVIRRIGTKSLVIGSTDLSHYYPYAHALELDGQVARNLGSFDIAGLTSDLEADKCEACGAGAVVATMAVSRKLGANAAKVLKYANSGDVSGDKASVVGYISAVFYQEDEGLGT
ncbi:MAG TPA: AmmeMemoRadiSam system protein B [Syntrophorhabdales bacterium]|nr:AmmeMemoRadiSam system protein B [Syntrophorhabdales bacterium]